MNAEVRNLVARVRLAASDQALDIGQAWNLLDECAETLDSMSRTAVRRHRVIRRLRRRCERRVNAGPHAEARRSRSLQPDVGAGGEH